MRKYVQMRSLFADVHGARMHYERAGRGRQPLLLLHGLIGSSRNWHRNVDFLAGTFDVIALDLFNLDTSVASSQLDAGLEATADRIAAFLDALGLKQVDVAGHSRGGAVALMFAARHPDRVRRIVLFAPANPFCDLARNLIWFYGTAPGALLARIIPVLPQALKAIALRRMYGDPTRIVDGSLERYTDVLRLPGTVEHILDILRRWTSDMGTLKQQLGRLAGKPTLMIWGDRDRAVGLASAAELQKVLPHSKLVVLPGVGHIPFEEMPEICNRAMQKWLEAPDRAVCDSPAAPQRASSAAGQKAA